MNIRQLLSESSNQYLYEGLNSSEKHSVMLWESAGYAIKEAALSADQIQQLFTSIEKGATASGSNRTLVGKGKDVADAVKTAYDNLVSKVQNSAPIKNIDAKYDQAAEKLKQATGGDQGVMQYVEKYRKFANEHPIAQSLIYSALIAAAGISGVGVGGAAALGLLKMTDKLLQGEKFSTAVGKGVATGAMAYGASKIADLFKSSTPSPSAATSGPTQGLSPEQVDHLKKLGAEGNKMIAKDNALWIQGQDGPTMLTPPRGVSADQMLKVAQDTASTTNTVKDIAGTAIDTAQELTASQMSAIEKALADGKKLSPQLQASYDLTKGDAGNRLGAAKSGWYDSIERDSSKKLSEGQVYLVFNRVSAAQLNEGIWDSVKGAAGKVAGAVSDKAHTIGHNLTTKVTANKLNKAWQSAGSPTDSNELAAFLKQQGVTLRTRDLMSLQATVLKTIAGKQTANT
jgi:hypothetical protein